MANTHVNQILRNNIPTVIITFINDLNNVVNNDLNNDLNNHIINPVFEINNVRRNNLENYFATIILRFINNNAYLINNLRGQQGGSSSYRYDIIRWRDTNLNQVIMESINKLNDLENYNKSDFIIDNVKSIFNRLKEFLTNYNNIINYNEYLVPIIYIIYRSFILLKNKNIQFRELSTWPNYLIVLDKITTKMKSMKLINPKNSYLKGGNDDKYYEMKYYKYKAKLAKLQNK